MTWTLESLAQHESLIKGSLFRARAVSVADEAAALDFLAEVSVVDATHNCWAFRTGQRFRSSDDGEPSGTAGRPILSAIEGQDFDNVMVVVTRWYGGVKLGAGGLVRAYGGAAAACLRGASKIEQIEMASLRFHCPFSVFSLVEAKLPLWKGEKTECVFDAEGVWLTVAVPKEGVEGVEGYLKDMTRGQVAISRLDRDK